MFAMVSMMRITGVEISKSQNVRNKLQFRKVSNALNMIYTVCAMLEMMIQTMFAMVSMMRITGVEISKKAKCVKQAAFSKSLKTL